MNRSYYSSVPAVINAAALTADFTAATSDIITSAAHGLVTDDVVTLTTTTTLPAGLSASTYYYVKKIDVDTFYLSTEKGGTNVNVTDTGTGTHTFWREQVSSPCNVADYRHVTVTIDTADSAALKIEALGSIQTTYPVFGQTQSSTNSYDKVCMIDLEDATAVYGDDGITLTGTDDHRLLSINTDGLTSIAFRTLAFTAGTLVVKIRGFN